ncbi:MAG: polyprenol monophosphomannose synthase [Saprospiraceae bacterium]|nr:polyprenol monophosphomannose synthase [Saprospiraceae bacterium]
MQDALIILPTYNEKENIENIIRAIFSLNKKFDFLVVDDNSPDGTATRVKELKDQWGDRLHLQERSGKLGLGTAYIAGFKYALERVYQHIFEMDADFSHNPKDLLRLLKAVKDDGADLAIGSRYVGKGGIKNWPADRLILSFGASLYVRMITWMNIKDPTAGFICYHRRVLEALDFEKIKFIGYAFQIEMKYYSHLLGFKLVEIPITFTDRILGKSKMNSSIISEAIKGVLTMRWKSLRGYYKRI